MLSEPIFLFAIYMAVLVAGIILTRYIFAIPTLLKNAKAQTALLAEMAQKTGVDETVINYITNKAK